MATKPKKPTVKITVKASASDAPKRPAAPKTSISRGASIAQSPKITGGKVAAKKPSLASQATKAASKVVSRAKTVAREARDIPTAVGTVARTVAAGKSNKGYRKEFAVGNLKRQIGEVKDAAKSGAKGSAAITYPKKRTNR